ncbi:replication protein [Streptococcus sp. S784/96/1]|uniref:replication protein n=1 Tax=Streptococcus sp. S784/96/1 TaxID=2653499 RepID=UPI0013897FB1|nr:replication protein [Streptococcus sp. S784/96/1]
MTDKLNKRQEAFLSNLLLTGNVTKASELANISRGRAYEYLKNATFKRVYRERRSEQLKEATALLQVASIKAVKVLTDIMEDETISPYARQQAANTILSTAYKAVETVEVVEMVEELEARIESE